MLKLGIEPKTFALLARRSNQLSYSSTDLGFFPSLLALLILITHSKRMLLKTDSSFDDDLLTITLTLLVKTNPVPSHYFANTGCASVLNTCFDISTTLSSLKRRYKYFVVSPRKKLSILSSFEDGLFTFRM